MTGGATPFGEWLASLSGFAQIGPIRGDRVAVGAGVVLSDLEARLAEQGLFFPPVPTFRGACVGGATATNAAGAVTFKYGAMRRWIRGLSVVLAGGDVLQIARGECLAHPDGSFEIELTSGERRRVPLPRYAMPEVPKRSAGYHAEPGMDLVDLFVGAEGTLGVVVEVELALLPRPDRVWGWATFESEAAALTCAGSLRAAAQAAWAQPGPDALDVSAVESLDRRCLELLREDGSDREQGLPLDAAADTALLFELELRTGAAESGVPDALLERLTQIFGAAGALDSLKLALPGDARRAAALAGLREAVPEAINRRVALAQRSDPRVHKVAGDMIVAFEDLPATLSFYREAFRSRGLDHALFGHVSDGNIHANALPRTGDDVRAGLAALLEMGDEVIRRGGCPLAEHGVGRNPVKQQLLRRLYGEAGLEQMRRVKEALDPEWKLAPGVLFPR